MDLDPLTRVYRLHLHPALLLLSPCLHPVPCGVWTPHFLSEAMRLCGRGCMEVCRGFVREPGVKARCYLNITDLNHCQMPLLSVRLGLC